MTKHDDQIEATIRAALEPQAVAAASDVYQVSKITDPVRLSQAISLKRIADALEGRSYNNDGSHPDAALWVRNAS